MQPCMYVWMYVCMHLCVNVCMCVCICISHGDLSWNFPYLTFPILKDAGNFWYRQSRAAWSGNGMCLPLVLSTLLPLAICVYYLSNVNDLYFSVSDPQMGESLNVSSSGWHSQMGIYTVCTRAVKDAKISNNRVVSHLRQL